jgi:hypothetical protein
MTVMRIADALAPAKAKNSVTFGVVACRMP